MPKKLLEATPDDDDDDVVVVVVAEQSCSIRHATMARDRNRDKQQERQGYGMDVTDLTDVQWERNLTSYTSGVRT
jgi:hypothetical protein